MGATNEVPLYGNAVRAFDEVSIASYSIPNVSLNAFSDLYQANQTIEATFIPSYLYEHDTIPSYSYGMHIGSVPLSIPGSLVLGGYDKNWVLGDVSRQPYSSGDLPIDLLDIKIGVVSGGSPWTYTDKPGLLRQRNTSIDYGITSPTAPAKPSRPNSPLPTIPNTVFTSGTPRTAAIPRL
ncbi:hypothetical protein RU639_005078 [Aspergillus parasiticus]